MPTINQLIIKKGMKKRRTINVKALNSCPQKRGICMKVRIVKPKKPNSSQRKIVKVRLSTRREILAYIPGQGHSLKSYSVVFISGGRANDLPGVRHSCIRGLGDFSWQENFIRMNKRSKYGKKIIRYD